MLPGGPRFPRLTTPALASLSDLVSENEMRGYVVAEDEVAGQTRPGDTASVRVTIGPGSTSERLVQRVERFGRGRSTARELAGDQEVLYVVSGSGKLHVAGRVHELEPDTGAFVAAGDEYVIENNLDEELVLVCVRAPQEAGARPDSERRTVRFADREPLPAKPNREFRYLVNQDLGCLDVTQFVGLIPPGRAPMHSHTYDEVIYVVEGKGVLHLDGDQTPIAAGSCIHLPPYEEHCLENTGASTMRVLGVFHPSGDPASRTS
jgi:mannose-6-phosphate isomerase-like protein (cupin superfamily)